MGDLDMMMWLDPMLRWGEFNKLKDSFGEKRNCISVFGLSDSQKCHAVASMLYPLKRQCLYITYSDAQARRIYEDLSFFYPGQVLLFPARDTFFFHAAAHSNEIAGQRLTVLERLVSRSGILVVASIEAVLTLQTPAHFFASTVFDLKVGDEISLGDLAGRMVNSGYERVSAIEGRGQFSLRGGIFDVFPLTADRPCRVEFFDEEVDSIRYFDTISQRSTEKTDKVVIPPARELILTEESINAGMERIGESFHEAVRRMKLRRNGKHVRLEEKIGNVLENLESRNFDDSMLNYISMFYSEHESILDYMDSSARVVLDEPSRIRDRFAGWYYEFKEHFEGLLKEGQVLPEEAEFFITYDDFLGLSKKYSMLCLQALPKSNRDIVPEITYHFMSRSIPAYQGKLDILADDIRFWKDKKYSIILLTGSSSRGEGLVASLKEYGIEAFLSDEGYGELMPGQIAVVPGTIGSGFEYLDSHFAIVSDKEIYGVSKRKKRVRKKTAKLDTFTDLKIGDFVVHENHGIGKYIGIETLVVNGQKRDYLHIKYSGTDKLYVPTDQMDLIQPYIGMGEKEPRLSKLGGAEWQKAKNKVRKSIKELAIDLLNLYAQREAANGYAFSTDNLWQKQFEDHFPYEETPDQLKAIEEIKKDMESNRVMDRLLCGDVGYGKTEVAIRAAFKAASDGMQVAVLAPTTILAQQHYNTFVRRFEEFPFNIQVLSRFRTSGEQRAILKTLREGNTDIIIGTHRLLGKDVRYKNLGLLIVDEEQRFGVGHKETIKNIKKNVDVLTLTATPIPRTLHMSLVGIRDISLIETPPEDRYPVQTYVVEYNESLLRDAIMREVQRGGQIYFVYNRVKTMERMAEKIRNLVPEISVAMAHGQMNEHLLEKIMMDFYDGKYDLLLCSTIIESGLDIPNVNTMIVYDADYFGLSQLYQLRGRVGRSNRIAYAYFTYRKDKILSEVAEKRLQAIKEFTEFGSGFKIAMRDLEIRGAGNLLGPEQHGHMTAVGYDLYCKMLEETVHSMKGETRQETVETMVDIKVDAHIGEDYIADESQKIEIYKRIAAIEGLQDKYDVEEELEDRFGDMPAPVRNLIDIAYVKAVARDFKFVEIVHREREVQLKLNDEKAMDPRVLMIVLNENRGNLTFSASRLPIFRLKLFKSTPETALKETKNLLEKIKDLHES